MTLIIAVPTSIAIIDKIILFSMTGKYISDMFNITMKTVLKQYRNKRIEHPPI